MVTIDPARRLANSLGLDALTNQPTRIEGHWPGELHALMLDPKGTFDDLIRRYSDSEQQAEDIKVNRIYRNLTGTLSGTQEYMAMEKLYELVEEGGFDLVVVDTPPSRNALDFLDAPRRLTHFLENRLFQALMTPDPGRAQVHGGGRPGPAPHHLQGGRGRHRPRRRRLLPGLRGHGGGIPDPGGPGPRAAGPGGHRLRRWWPRPGPTRWTRPCTSPASWPNRACRSPPWWSTGSSPGSPRTPSWPSLQRAGRPGGTARALGELVENLAGYTSASDREEQAFADLVARWPRPPSTGCPCSTPTSTTSTGWARSPTCCSPATGRPRGHPPGPRGRGVPEER